MASLKRFIFLRLSETRYIQMPPILTCRKLVGTQESKIARFSPISTVHAAHKTL